MKTFLTRVSTPKGSTLLSDSLIFLRDTIIPSPFSLPSTDFSPQPGKKEMMDDIFSSSSSSAIDKYCSRRQGILYSFKHLSIVLLQHPKKVAMYSILNHSSLGREVYLCQLQPLASLSRLLYGVLNLAPS